MPSPARIKGHPIHVMLVAYPIGLWTFSVICDVIIERAAERRPGRTPRSTR